MSGSVLAGLHEAGAGRVVAGLAGLGTDTLASTHTQLRGEGEVGVTLTLRDIPGYTDAVQAAVAVFEELVAVTGTSAAAMFLKVEPGAVTRDTELVCACAGRGLQQLLALRQGAAPEDEAALRYRL